MGVYQDGAWPSRLTLSLGDQDINDTDASPFRRISSIAPSASTEVPPSRSGPLGLTPAVAWRSRAGHTLALAEGGQLAESMPGGCRSDDAREDVAGPRMGPVGVRIPADQNVETRISLPHCRPGDRMSRQSTDFGFRSRRMASTPKPHVQTSPGPGVRAGCASRAKTWGTSNTAFEVASCPQGPGAAFVPGLIRWLGIDTFALFFFKQGEPSRRRMKRPRFASQLTRTIRNNLILLSILCLMPFAEALGHGGDSSGHVAGDCTIKLFAPNKHKDRFLKDVAGRVAYEHDLLIDDVRFALYGSSLKLLQNCFKQRARRNRCLAD